MTRDVADREHRRATPAMCAWIDAYVADQGNVAGYCKAASSAMVKVFPWLRVACGLVVLTREWHDEKTVEHWWCVNTADESIIDPTVAQFHDVQVREYMEIDLDDTCLPTGRCLNCGEPCFNYAYHCSDDCSEDTLAHLSLDQRRPAVGFRGQIRPPK